MEEKPSKKIHPVLSPATGKYIGEILETPLEKVTDYYHYARKTFPVWRKTALADRINYLRQLRLYMVDHLDELAYKISESTGKVAVEALTADVVTVLDSIKYIEKHAQCALQKRKMPTPLFLSGKKSYIEYKPRGVVLVISPWNYPFQLAMIPVISALVAGNTVILKTSEVTPLIGTIIAEIFENIKLPAGVVQVAHGGKELGAALVKEKPDYIFFTGSVHTGKKIQAEAAKELIPTTLELGGKDPMLVFADAPLDRAVKAAVWGAFTNSGQVCMSIERLYVHRKIYPQFIEKLQQETKKLKLGFSEDDDIGSITLPGQIDIIKAHVEDALSKGGKLLTGQLPKDWDTKKGLYIAPMIIIDIKQNMKIIQEEFFGPILPVIAFDTEEEVIRLANDSIYGLHASVWSANTERAKQIATELIFGNVVINDVIVSVANPHLPFGGTKYSGIGHYHGETGLQMFCYPTSVVWDRGRKKTEVNWYPYKGKYPLFVSLAKSYFGKRKRWPNIIKSITRLLKK